jgi:hypothetical protein
MEAATAFASAMDASLPARLDAIFQQAASNVEVVERRYVFAGRRARIRYAGFEMFDLLGHAFGHLLDDSDGAPDLTIDVWDSESSRSPAPPLPTASSSDAFGSKYYYGDDRVRAHFQPASGALTVMDLDRSHAWYWFGAANRLPDWERAASIRQILHWWLPRFGVHEVHGGAIGIDEGGVLLVGRGGSGKSTTALSSLGVSGMRYAADDYIAVRAEPTPYAFSLYSSGKLEPAHSERLPHLAAAASNALRLDTDDKAVFYVHEAFPDHITNGFPLRAVLMPRITPARETKLVRVPPAMALAALAPSTLLQLHPPTDDGWAAMAQLVRQLDCLRIDLGSDIDAIPRTILRYLRNEETPT